MGPETLIPLNTLRTVMNAAKPLSCRHSFLKATAAVATGLSELAQLSHPAWSSDADVNIIGPKPGYSPQVGTLVSMLTWMRMVVLMSVKGMSQKDLDTLFDTNSNTIGALLSHLGGQRDLLPIEYL